MMKLLPPRKTQSKNQGVEVIFYSSRGEPKRTETMRLRSDDSVARARRRISAHLGVPSSELYFWTTIRDGSLLDDAANEIVACASNASRSTASYTSNTSTSFETFETFESIKASDLKRAYENLLCLQKKGPKYPKRIQGSLESAVVLVRDEWGVPQGTIPVGVRWAHVRNVKSDGSTTSSAWWSFPMEFAPADPFYAQEGHSSVSDFKKSGKYVPWTEGESWLLEDFLCDKLHVATREQITDHLKDPKAVELFFPLGSDSGELPEAVEAWDEYVDVSLNAMDALIGKSSVDASTILLNCSTRVGSVSGLVARFDADSLYEWFAKFEVSHEVPCIVFHDGSSPTVKIFKDAIQTQEGQGDAGDLPVSVLRRWRREATGERNRKKASLRAYCAVYKRPLPPGEVQQYASYVINADLSAHILASGLGRYGPQESAAFRQAVLEVGAAIDRNVVHRIEALMKAADVSIVLRSAKIAMEQRQPFQKMSFRVSLTAGRDVHMIPSVAEIQSVIVSRLSSVLTLVATASGGKTILSYTRASGASKFQRAQLVVRLMSGRPKAEIEREMISAFAMSPEDAKSFVETSTQTMSFDASDPQPRFQGPVNYRMEVVPIIELRQNGRIGYEATVINVARIEYMERINRILKFVVAEAAGDKLPKLFPSLPYEMFDASKTSLTTHQDPVQTQKIDKQVPPSDKEEEDDELDQWLEDEIAGLDEEATTSISTFDEILPPDEDEMLNPLDAQDEKEERLGAVEDSEEEENDDENDKDKDKDDDGTPENHILSMLRKADRTLFKYPGSRYATDCARNMMRQPVVLTREELDRTNKLYPNGHSGAIVNYGTTPDKAAENAYICPEIWCPRSKIALTREQFEKLGKKCPGNDGGDVEEPIVFESKYFSPEKKGSKNAKGSTHNPGFLDRRKHPGGFCMPCCFIKKQQHFDRCGATLFDDRPSETSPSPSRSRRSQPSSSSSSALSLSKKESAMSQEGKYIRGAEVWPLEPGRYGMLPGVLAEALLGDKFKCGNRDDGSGQLMVTSQCFVRRGAPKSASKDPNKDTRTPPSRGSVFMECAAYVLGHPSAEALMDILTENLSAGVFLTLDGGRVARRWMDGLDPIEIVEADPGIAKALAAWFNKDERYVTKFGLEGVAFSSASVSDILSSPELMREVLVFKAMNRYLTSWRNQLTNSEEETEMRRLPAGPHADGMLDLLSRPHSAINPNRVNLILMESIGGGMSATVPCASDGADVSSRWRAKDPMGIILSLERLHYEPIVRTSLVRGGVKEVRTFYPDAFQRLSTLVRGYLGTCSTRGRDRISSVFWALKNEGHAVTTQVIDCFFRLAGLMTTTNLFVPLIGMNMPVLAGEIGARLKIAYLGDVVTTPTPFARGQVNTKEVAEIESMFARLSEVSRIPGLRPRDRLTSENSIVALRLANGGLVPLVPNALNSRSPLQYGRERVHATQYLEHLSSLVRVRREPDRATEWADRWDEKERRAWELKSRVVKALRSDVKLSSELVALRSSLHPFTVEAKRKEAVRIVRDALNDSSQPKDRDAKDAKNGKGVQELADALLFGPKPLSLRREDIKITDAKDKAIVFTDAELASGELDVLIQSLDRIRLANTDDPDSEKISAAASSAAAAMSQLMSEKEAVDLSPSSHEKTPEPPKRPVSPIPLDEDSLVRYVGSLHDSHGNPKNKGMAGVSGVSGVSNAMAHRSWTYRQRRIRLVPNVDVYSTIHLAHQMLFTDAPAPLEDAVKAVQNTLMAAMIAGDINKLDGTLGKMLEKQKKRHRHLFAPQKEKNSSSPMNLRKKSPSVRQYIAGKLASAIAWRGADYSTSTFEISELSKYLDVRVKLIPPGQSHALSAAVVKSSKRSRKQGISYVGETPYVILVENAEGKGHDLALSPAEQDVPGAGHRILFRAPISGKFSETFRFGPNGPP